MLSFRVFKSVTIADSLEPITLWTLPLRVVASVLPAFLTPYPI